MLRDLIVAARFLARSPLWTAGIILTLIIGTACLSLVGGVLDAAFLQPVGSAEPDRLFTVYRSLGPQDHRGLSLPDLRAIQARLGDRAELSGFARFRPTVALGDGVARMDAQLVSGSFFEVAQVGPQLGRLLTKQDDDAGSLAAVVSFPVWRDYLGANESVIGSQIEVNRVSVTVVGIAQAGFAGLGWDADIWLPISAQPRLLPAGYELLTNDTVGWLSTVGRLRGDTTRADAARSIRSVGVGEGAGEVVRGANTVWRANYIRLWPGHVDAFGGVLATLAALSGAVVFVSSLNCGLLWNARAQERDRELRIRKWLGASSALLSRRRNAELALLALGSGMGSALSVGALTPYVSSLSLGIPIPTEISRTPRMMLITFISSLVVFMLLIGVRQIAGFAKDGAERPTRRRSLLGLTWCQLVTAGVVAGLALSMAVRTDELGEARASVRPETLAMFDLQLAGEAYPEPVAKAFVQRLTRDLGEIPHVSAVGMASQDAFHIPRSYSRVERQGVASSVRSAIMSSVSPGILDVLDLQLLAGRFVSWNDGEAGEPVVVVDQRLVEQLGLRGTALGEPLIVNGDQASPLTIVGVVSPETHHPLTDDIGRLYVPLAQDFHPATTVHLRSPEPPRSVLREAASIVAQADPHLVVDRPRSGQQGLDQSMTIHRQHSTVAMALAWAITLLAVAGAAGLVTRSIEGASRSLAIRVALGAQANRIRLAMLQRVWGVLLVAEATAVVGAALARPAAESVVPGLSTELVLHSTGIAATVVITTSSALLWGATRKISLLNPAEVLRRDH